LWKRWSPPLFGENIRNLGKAHQDSKEDTIYVISNFLIRFCYYELTLFGDPEIAINSPPDTPATPSGPIWGLPNQPYTYTTSTTDPDGDQVYYTWDWGDGNFSDWLGPYVSGLIAGASHTWTDIGMYNVRVKAKDVFYAESNWSEPLSVAIAIPGDLDFDGDVDILDLLQLLANCGTTEGATYEEGDIDSDGDVDLADLAALLGNYGTGT